MKKRMGKGAIVSTILAVTVGLVLGVIGMAVAADQPIKLKYQGKWIGNIGMGWADGQRSFADRVKAKTGGRVEIELMDEVKPDNQVIDGVKSGVIDIGSQGLHSRGEIVLPNFIGLPGVVAWDKAPEMYDRLRPMMAEFWEKTHGVHYLGMNFYLANYLFTNKPCTSFAELTKMKLRINGNATVQMIRAAGGNPIVMNQSEVFTSVQRGVIDGVQVATPGYLDSGLYEVAKYISAWPLGVMGLAVTVNKDSWSRLNPELQKLVTEAWLETEKAQFEGAKSDTSKAEAKVISLGSQRMDAPKADQDKLASFSGSIIEDWKKRAGANADAVFKVINEVQGSNF